MKLLVDLFPCQTNSRFRGIGRYTLSLVREMAQFRGSNELYALADARLSEGFEELRQEFIRILPTGSFLPYHHGPMGNDSNNTISLELIAETLIRQAYQTISPDVVLTPNPFEMDQHGVVPGLKNKGGSYKQVGILYDLIPYIFHERYLDGNPEYKKKYHEVINSLPNYDLLLAISEATRQDAINILNIAPEKIVNISGAMNSSFRKLELSQEDISSFTGRFGISRPFILYIGGNNFRKNMEGALRAYAQLPPHIIESHQFVINDAGDETAFRTKARSLGLRDQDIVVTGYISDKDLIVSYNLCKVFIFPSFYEGFGLPVLEAMACGAPIIASNNSSLPEVIGRSDVLFNASDNQEITSVLQHVLIDDSFRKELSNYGLQRAKHFSWEKSALHAWTAIESIQQERKTSYFPLSRQRKSRPRIAFLSPLPPQKSGISNYSVELLPYLAKYFEIDLFTDPHTIVSNTKLRKNFSVFDWNKLLQLKDQYETVVYNLGNSPFHAYMLDLERQFPGVVVLHDFYLSDLVAYVNQQNGLFLDEIDYSHGLEGLIAYQIKKNGMFLDWPINWKVLRYAREIIVHSNYQDKLLKKYYGRGWRPRLNIIPHLREAVPEVTKKQRLNARKELGIGKDDFLICSFGILTPKKLNETLIQTYKLAQRELEKDTKVIFVGECFTEEYFVQITALVEELALGNQISITGFVTDETYKKYLVSTNVAIQLRKDSRGETSGAVLDCMNYGVPVIVNAHGSLEDLNQDDVIKISDPVQFEELASVMIQLRKDESLRVEKGKRSRQAISDQHNPEQVAASYADVIDRAILSDDRTLFAPLFESVRNLNKPADLINSSAEYAAKNFSLRSQPRLLIDVSTTAFFDARSGIQRVVKSVVREFFNMADSSLHVEPIWLNDGQFLRAFRFTEKLLNLPDQSLGPETAVNIRPGDTLFMLDSTWHLYDQFIPMFKKVRENGGKIVTMVYDLIPIRFPKMVDEIMVLTFTKWMSLAILQSDMLICISQSTANDVKDYIKECNFSQTSQLDIVYFHLGADILVVSSESGIRLEVSKLKKASQEPLFIMVGTLEPRKGHEFVLDAFDSLWQQGYPYRLCFAGKVGWHVKELEHRIRHHSKLGANLFFFENPTDAEINHCYQSAMALIAASKTEGFGLPIIEAAQHQIPVLASDIPVFREVGGDGVVYFSLESSDQLAGAVREMAMSPQTVRTELAMKVKYSSWKESAALLLAILENNKE